MMGRPVDRSPLCAADPVPGDPNQVERDGRRFVEVAERIEHVAKRVRAAADGLDMSSLAVVAFCDNAHRAASDVLRAYEKYRGTGEALLGYVPQHRLAQDESLAALRQAQEAQAQMHSAQRIVDMAQANLAAAAPGADTAQDMGAYRRGLSLVQEAANDLEAARRRLEAAVEAWDRAAQHAMGLIEQLGLGSLLDALGNVLAFTVAELDALAQFFGDAWDVAQAVWDMINPWSTNSIWGRATQTSGVVLGTLLDTIDSMGKYVPSWSRVGKYAGRVGIVTALVSSGLTQYFKDEQAHPSMALDKQISRTVGQSITVGGAAVVGGAIGASIGFALGGPGGAIAGGLILGTAAATVADQFNDGTVRAFGRAGDTVADWGAETYHPSRRLDYRHRPRRRGLGRGQDRGRAGMGSGPRRGLFQPRFRKGHRRSEPAALALKREGKLDEEDELLAEASRRSVAGQPYGKLDFLQRFLTFGIPWIARLQPENVCNLQMNLPGVPRAVRDRAALVLQSHGKLVDNQGDGNAGRYRVRGIVFCGFAHLGRGLVTATITPSRNGGSDVQLRGVSKEPLIKQRYGEKSAHRVADALRQPVSEVGGTPWPS